MLSRNFRLQRVGTLDWLERNYNFSHISFFIDELVVLDVSRIERDARLFREALKTLTARCFVPIAAGGGVRTIDDVYQLLRAGADKIVINTLLFENPQQVKLLAREFGQQCVVGSVDVKLHANAEYRIFIENGSRKIDTTLVEALSLIKDGNVGELYLNSIDRDGTGQGYDFGLLNSLPTDHSIPVILAGGVGNGNHLLAGLKDDRVDAVATAHLFNFVGDGLQKARGAIVHQGAPLASWPPLHELSL